MFPAILRRDVLLLLAIKAAGLTILYFLFFSPANTIAPGARLMQTHLLTGATQDYDHGHR